MDHLVLDQHAIRATLLLVLLGNLVRPVLAAQTSAAEPLRVAKDSANVTVHRGDRLLAEYRYAGVPFKPYLGRFLSPGGVNVLRDAPHDHLHHHALMFAVAVDGHNFWEEYPKNKPGKQVSRALQGPSVSTGDAGATARWTQQLDWVAHDGTLRLEEQRTIEIHHLQDNEVSLLSWRTRLAPPPGTPEVKLVGSPYFGLGMRFVPSMDRAGRFLNAGNDQGEPIRGTRRLVPARWTAYTASVDGKPVTVAMFDHAKNPRHPARFLTMTAPFAYLSATLNLAKQPLTLGAGEPVRLDYGVALWDGQIPAPQIEALYQRWHKLVADRPPQ